MHTRNKLEGRTSLNLFLLYVLLSTQLALLIALATENTSVERVCNYVLLFTVFAQYAVSLAYEPLNNRLDMLFLTLVAYLLVVLMYYRFEYDYLVVMLTFLTMVMVWRTIKTLPYNLQVNTIVGSFFLIQALILIALYFSPMAYAGYEENVATSNELTLGFSNPNQTGTILFSTIVILVLASSEEPKKFKKWIMRLECVALAYLLFLTGARTSVLGLAFFLWFLVSKRKLRKHYFLADAIFCFQVPFVFIYNRLAQTSLKTAEFMGKKIISGRQRVYAEALRIWTNKWTGNLDRSLFANFHNAALTILVNIGIIGFALYLFYTLGAFNQLYKRSHTKKQLSGIIAIVALFLMGWAESAVLTGGTLYYVHMFTILVLTGYDSADEDDADVQPERVSSYIRRRN